MVYAYGPDGFAQDCPMPQCYELPFSSKHLGGEFFFLVVVVVVVVYLFIYFCLLALLSLPFFGH